MSDMGQALCVKKRVHAMGVENLQSSRQYSPMLILGKWKVMEQRHSSCHHPGLCTSIAEGSLA